MRKCLIAFSLSAAMFASGAALAHGEDDPLLATLFVDQLEYGRDGADEVIRLDADLWIGHDLHKLWFKTELERENSSTEHAELQILYSRAIAPYWDVQAGVRHDFQPGPERSWGVLGLQGLAPYFFEVDAALFVGESGRSALRLEAEYDLLLSQRLILSPELELNLYGRSDEERLIGSGLAELEAGLRLRYEFRREFAPYVGVNWQKRFGNTADLLEQAGHKTESTEWVVGLRFWY